MRVELRDSLEFLYTDSEVGRCPRREMRLDVARGGTAAVHVLLNGLREGTTLRFALRGKRGGVPATEWFRLVDVPVEKNTGPVAFVEKPGEHNPHVTRGAPFRVFDAMEPVQSSVKVSASSTVLRLHLPISLTAKPGERPYTIEIEAMGECARLKLMVAVHRPAIPPVGAESFPNTTWFALDLMAQRHGLKLWGEAHWRMIRRYADLMVRGRQNTFLCMLPDFFTVQRKKPVLNRNRLRRIVKTFTGAGMHFIEGGHVAWRTGRKWDARTFETSLTADQATTPAGNATLATIARALMAEIRRNGWQGRWLQHVADEPMDYNATDYRVLTGMVRKYMPGLPILDATMELRLTGSVDIWCPQAQEFLSRRKAFEALRRLGDRLWFYTCCYPGGPWLNRLLDMELLRPALLGWGAALYRLDGYLHWGLNRYRPQQDPFEQSVVQHSPGDPNLLPAGDTHIVYPGEGRPWSSLRLEAQREGFEDLELLRILQARDGAATTRIVQGVIRGFDRYTKKASVLRKARKALLQALS